MSGEGPSMSRRRSSRLAAQEDAAGSEVKPTIMKRKSTTSDLRGALEGMGMSKKASMSKKPSMSKKESSGEIVSAAKSFARFKKIDQVASKPQPTAKQQVAKARFDSKINKFEAKAAAASQPAAGVRGARNKIAAFENKTAEEEMKSMPSFRKTWKVGPGGGYQKKTEFAGGRAQKKSIADLP